MKDVMIYSTAGSRYFADLIARQLGIDVGGIERKKFGGGEEYYRIGINDRAELIGKTIIFVSSTNTDADFLELERVGCALAGYGSLRRIFVIPFLGYSTMERAKRAGEVVTAKTIARDLSKIPNSGLGNVFLMLDLHVAGLLHYFEGDCLRYELYAEEVLAEAIRELKLKNFMFASADLGRPSWVQTYANQFGTDVAFIRKLREFERTRALEVIGRVLAKNVIIYDDMTRSGGTLIDATKAYIEKGAKKIYALLSHLALDNEEVIRILEESGLQKIISTNSHPMSQHELIKQSEKFVVKDVSGEFVKIIKKILKED